LQIQIFSSGLTWLKSFKPVSSEWSSASLVVKNSLPVFSHLSTMPLSSDAIFLVGVSKRAPKLAFASATTEEGGE